MNLINVDHENYRHQLSNILSTINSTHRPLLCDFEITSPHAAIDASSGANQGLQTVQIMACDRGSRNVPYNVYCDYFLLDSSIRHSWYKNSWLNSKEKLLFLGETTNTVKTEKKDFLSESDREVYFFTPAELSKRTISQICMLSSFCKSKGLTFKVKTHPRDSKEWLHTKEIEKESIEIVSEESVDYEKLNFAFCGRSAVIFDLIASKVPFICFTDLVAVLEAQKPIYQKDDYPGFIDSNTNFIDLFDELVVTRKHIDSLHNYLFDTKNERFTIDRLFEEVNKL